MCIRYSPDTGIVHRVYPTKRFADKIFQGMVLVNPKPEDLTYLTLLGIDFRFIENKDAQSNYENAYTKGSYRAHYI